MPSSPLFARLVLLAAGLSLLCFAPLRADDFHDAVEQTHGLLKQAMGGDSGTPPANAQITTLLQQAEKVLEDQGPGHHGGHRKQAVALLKSALDTLAQGDPEGKVQGMIRDADAEVRDME